jgi:hypothetical protein
MMQFIAAVTSPDFEGPATKVVLAMEAEEMAAARADKVASKDASMGKKQLC